MDKVKEQGSLLNGSGLHALLILGTASASGLPQLLLNGESARCWVGGKVASIRSTSRHHGNTWCPTPVVVDLGFVEGGSVILLCREARAKF